VQRLCPRCSLAFWSPPDDANEVALGQLEGSMVMVHYIHFLLLMTLVLYEVILSHATFFTEVALITAPS